MSLSNFFRINLPYGIARNSNNEWIAFNREYLPIGWNDVGFKRNDSFKNSEYGDLPLYTKYKNISKNKIDEIIYDKELIRLDDKNEIEVIWFYNDKTNPTVSNKWDSYFKIIEKLAHWEVVK
ncbi:hypothetical protein U0038_17565 [Sphingobacterium spiritivorum]|uniref:Uncharacterized protein n=1 Tax=Sphingobacterium spiritivorum ATCC 33861 TaxID=525373 RepID=D7VN47_SPHSI|nr:hypothetical protein [Sphingobacterium spiritivorum]EFK57344.1 hypothetical protein HMPREF0766_12417 [Sphingobacterium spiritivorum ATCC 33861]QQT36576.1 hypothetical protein I6J01_03855 [Sphingobacterium spiritivorum]WQD33327.1 hypothetical protein U0038_17565 [Sphingobacterium spiritivorum]SUJ22096.1 Uncharacterised protein [Sphingobacterium spiritivorum]